MDSLSHGDEAPFTDLPTLFPNDPMQLRTHRGHNFSEVSSAMQKAIRRNDAPLAGYWALELWQSGFGRYVWKRLLTISTEDCWGILTQEVKALHDSYLVINEGVPPKQARGRIFISKAVILLCLSKKNRDPDYLQNFVYDQSAGLDPETRAVRTGAKGGAWLGCEGV
jgi:replication-associated recombination protein RarA